MKIKMTHNQAREIVMAINAIMGSGEKLPGKFNYAVTKNSRLIKSELDGSNAARESFLGECDKEAGEVRKNKGLGAEEKQAQLEALNEKYKGDFDKWLKFLEEEVEIELHKIKVTDLPDTLTTAQVGMLFPLLEE